MSHLLPLSQSNNCLTLDYLVKC